TARRREPFPLDSGDEEQPTDDEVVAEHVRVEEDPRYPRVVAGGHIAVAGQQAVVPRRANAGIEEEHADEGEPDGDRGPDEPRLDHGVESDDDGHEVVGEEAQSPDVEPDHEVVDGLGRGPSSGAEEDDGQVAADRDRERPPPEGNLATGGGEEPRRARGNETNV